MFLPSISELRKFNLFGFGLQYSFGHFFQHKLPKAAQPLDVSLMFGYSTSGIGYRPDDYKGQMDLDIDAFTINMVIGYRPIKAVEVLMTLGYQYASMESSGKLISTEDPMEEIHPNNGQRGQRVPFRPGSRLPDRFLPPRPGLRLRRQVRLHHQHTIFQAKFG